MQVHRAPYLVGLVLSGALGGRSIPTLQPEQTELETWLAAIPLTTVLPVGDVMIDWNEFQGLAWRDVHCVRMPLRLDALPSSFPYQTALHP